MLQYLVVSALFGHSRAIHIAHRFHNVLLKRIILHGFKSFADRTEFEFGAGVTCVVGPNGCGKSNLLDALRWVLGEQSAHSLRGSKMADVIFAGSRSRKPLNFAEVQLEFENADGRLPCDEKDVVVGRVLYRNGDSEYRLNGKVVRRKDIRNLFLDTGIGVCAYSIIEQGRVDQLLQAGPIERREIFEEAAGISRYKVRRNEAERKLERSRNNLLRLADVIDELERRLRSVKLAAGKARRFQEYDQRLRELRSSFSLAEFHELETALAAAKAQVVGLSDRLLEQRSELAARDSEAAELEHALQETDERIQTEEAELVSRRTEASALAERITQGERRLIELAARRDQCRAQAGETDERLADLQDRIAAERDALRELADDAEKKNEQISRLKESKEQADQRCDGSRSALDRARTAAFDAVRQSALLRSEHENLEQQRTRLTGQTQRLTERQQALAVETASTQARRDELTARAATLDRDADARAAEMRGVDARLEALQREAEQLERRIGEQKEARSAVASRIDLLEDLERRHEGVDAGTQAVLAWREDEASAGGVVALVADLLRIDDARVACLQSVLATFENHVVVRDTYAFLAQLERRGGATGPVRVAALDRLISASARVSYAKAGGFIACAADWVTCDDEFRPLADHLLGRVIVVDTLERALALSSDAPESYTFVTLDGYGIGSDGRLTAGASKGDAGLISRKAEIRRLGIERDEIETQLERAARRRSVLEAARSDVTLSRAALLEQIAHLQKQHADARTQLARAEDEATRIEREGLAIAGELSTARSGLGEVETRVAELAARNEEVEKAQQEHESQIDALERELAELGAAVGRLARELTDALVDMGRTAEKRAASEEAVADLEARLESLEAERARAAQEADQAVRRIEQAESELRDARHRLAAVAEECERRQSQILQVRQTRQDTRQQLEACGGAARELHAAIKELDASLREREVELREIEVRRENLITRVNDELSIDLPELYGSYEHGERDWDAVRQEIEELRRKIERLGNVNLDAITELGELTPRYDNLVAQRDDLVTSIERLEALIEELNRESRVRFSERFEQIREHFQDLFRKLFGGGKADIILEDPNDPLECGIEIIARPPGKEPQPISLLSGGEKTLAAVSLLLAVFKSKPAPFAVLDEVDAALDESNVDRFNLVVQEFLVHSQFVIITHNKRTMQSADVLYGITMEDPGVSKRVSVRFDDHVETPFVA